jgi:hypothetical protein
MEYEDGKRGNKPDGSERFQLDRSVLVGGNGRARYCHARQYGTKPKARGQLRSSAAR